MTQLLTHPITVLSILASLNLLGACGSSSNPAISSGGATGVGEASATGGTLAIGGATGTGGASSSGDGSDASDAWNPDCVSQVNYFCSKDLSGIPFVAQALAPSDYCTANNLVNLCLKGVPIPQGETTSTLSYPQLGKLCLSGRVSPGGWAALAIEFAPKSLDRTTILSAFNAAGRGITQLTFTIDTPPSQGLTPNLHMVTATECPGNYLNCFKSPGFHLVSITTPGRVTAAFTDFTPDDLTLPLDTTRLHELSFSIASGDFNFCIHDLKFLDANGNEVTP